MNWRGMNNAMKRHGSRDSLRTDEKARLAMRTSSSGPGFTLLQKREEKMKTGSVVYVLKRFPRLSETFILNEILALEAMGLKLRIVSLYMAGTSVVHNQVASIRAQVHYIPQSFWRELPRMLRAQGHFLIRHPGRWIRAFSIMFWRFNLKAVRRWLQSGFLAQQLEGTDVRHIHAHFSTSPTTVAMMTSTLLDFQFSFTCHAKDVYADSRLHSPGFFRNLSRASFVVCASVETKQDIVEAWPDVPRGKIRVVYNGLDLERFRRRTSEPTNDPLILGVGRFVEKKGFPYLIEACRLLEDRSVPFKCEIVGYGATRKSLLELISSLGLEDRVSLVPPLAQDELVGYYRRASVFCLPTMIASNDDRDILPNVVKEAMAVGVPVITTALPGMDELVEHERSGLLVPQKNAPALADALEVLLEDHDLRRRLAQEGRRKIEERFDRSKNVAQLYGFLEGHPFGP